MAQNKKHIEFETNTGATHEGQHGDHPVGGAVGAAIGAAAGAAVAGAAKGAVAGAAAAGPAGAIAGAGVGGVLGALAGKGIAQAVNPTTEDVYWRDHYQSRPYIDSTVNYETYQPAYKYGIDAFSRYPGRSYDEIEPELRAGWESARGASVLSWDKASYATRDAYERLYGREDDYE
ncbi:MAG: hypothetical protein JO089_02370 [Alphaproteobacteria bacterium]|nr:hypothetical protein [Alphaproteobacteria bacterium]